MFVDMTMVASLQCIGRYTVIALEKGRATKSETNQLSNLLLPDSSIPAVFLS